MFLATVGLIFVDYYFLYIFPMIMWIILIVFATAYVAIALIWLPLYFNNVSYMVSSQEVIRCTGFFMKIRQIMNVSAIQYVTSIATPFSNITGFNFVIVNALGGNLLLLYLSKKDSEEIVRTLSEAINCRRK